MSLHNQNTGLQPQALKRAVVIGLLDVLSILGSFFAGLWLRYDFHFNAINAEYLEFYLSTIFWWCGLSVIVFALFQLYNSIWSFVSIDELFRAVGAYTVLGGIGVAYIALFAPVNAMPRSYYVLGFVFSFICTVCIRFSYRFFRLLKGHFSGAENGKKERVLIIGAGEAGRSLVNEFETSAYVKSRIVCAVDDNPVKRGKRLLGIPIVGNRYDIPKAVTEYQIDRIIFAIPTAAPAERKAILDICSTTGCPVQVLPGIYQLVSGEIGVSKLREVDAQDLLGRDPIRVNLDEILNYISGKVVMVTGGGGSIGSELCRQIARANPKQLIVFDIYENNAYDIQMELQRNYPDLNLEVLIGSVRNTARLDYVLGKYRPELVFHAAAHKHVPLMEDSPNEAIKNNVFGTYKMAMAASK